MKTKNFWKKLEKPILALAPMANVTDAVFRAIIAKYSCPQCRRGAKHNLEHVERYVAWTEFVSVEALLSEGRDIALVDFYKLDKHAPTVAQIFGSKPEQFEKVARQIQKAGVFDGIDINMGCPDKGVEKSGAGSALIKDPERAKAIILATKKGAPNLPVSVKTRMGYNTDVLEEWMAHLLEARPAAITMHLRTRKQMSKVPADWSRMRAMRELVDKLPESERPVLLGNGDVETLSQAGELCEEFGADGAMVGRGIFGTPWFFSGSKPSLKKQLKIMLEHTKLYVKTYGPERKKRKSEPAKLKAKDWLKNFDYMKKHYKAYCSDFDGAKELRIKLMEAENYTQIKKITKSFLKNI